MQNLTGLKVLISIAAVAIAVLHVAFPALAIDLVVLALFAVAVLPWLQPIFKSIKLPGGLEITLQDFAKKIDNATGAALSAERKADLAVSGLTTDNPVERAASFAPRGAVGDSAATELRRLSAQYEDIRATQFAGDRRTQAMTEVVRRMIAIAPSLQDFDVGSALRSASLGERLAAYAFLYARPDPSRLAELVASVTRTETKPFGQYWGLQAIGRNIGSADVPAAVVEDLDRFANVVQKGTDRHYEVQRILRQIGANR